jgi:hypothetical protein
MIGLSLSLCVRDLLEGKVRLEDVELVIAGTRAMTMSQFDDMLESYTKDYWRGDPCGKFIARYLFEKGKLFQPREFNPDAELSIAYGYWVRSNGWLLDRQLKAQVICNCSPYKHYRYVGEECEMRELRQA